MRVSYIGNFRHDFCTEVHVSKTLQGLGISVNELQEDELDAADIYDRAYTSDVLLYTRTWGFKSYRNAIRSFRRLKQSGTTTASYHLDLYLGISRENSIVGDPFWNTEYVFTPDGDSASQEKFEATGINHHYMKPGVFKPECVPGQFVEEYASDVAFVGSVLGYHREWPYRKYLHEFLTNTYGDRYVKHGHPESIVRGQDLNNLYASAKVIVGDTLCPGFKKPYYWSDRVYETLGRGGFLIHPYIKGMDEEFVDGEHLVFYDYNDWKGLQNRIDYYIKHDEERKQIAVAGQEFVRTNCTYENRLTQALRIMGYEL